MIKSMMVCVDGSAASGHATDCAIDLARRLQARMSACHVLDIRNLEGPLMADISGWLGAQPYGAQIPHVRHLLQERGEAILEAARLQVEHTGLEVDTRLRTGHPARVLLDEATRTELLVMGRQGEHAGLLEGSPGSVADRVCRQAGKPCLVVPGPAAPVGRILAAYDGSEASSRALHEAIELACALAVPMVLLSVHEGHDPAKAHALVEEGMQLVRAHEGVAAPYVAEGSPGPAILAKASELGCGLIALGAYGHARLREMLLGSVTQEVLASSTIPVLLVR